MTAKRPTQARRDVSLILNPRAGHGTGRRHADSMVKILARSGRRILCSHSDSAEHLGELVCEAAATGAEDILIAGGDGSLHAAVNTVLSRNLAVALGIIPVGTGNDFVKSLGTPRGWRNACEELAIALAENRRRHIDAGSCNDFFFLNSLGVGLDAQVAQAAETFRWLPGPLAYPAALVTILSSGIAATPVRITVDDMSSEQEASMVIACNGAWFGGLFHIAPHARVDDGSFCVVVADRLNRRQVARLVPRAIRGTHVDAPEAGFYSGSEIRIETAAPMLVESDGEILPRDSTDLHIRCLPAALTLIA